MRDATGFPRGHAAIRAPIQTARRTPVGAARRTSLRAALLALFALLALAALAACSKDEPAKGGAGASGGAAATDDAVVAAWRKAGLEVSALTDVEAKRYGATACRGGTAGGVDVVLCSYGSGDEAKAGEEIGLAAIADATGAALAKGDRLLVVADRRKSDPSGRTIDALTRAFRK